MQAPRPAIDTQRYARCIEASKRIRWDIDRDVNAVFAAESPLHRLVGCLFEIVDSSNWDALKEVFHPEIRYERPGYEPFVGLERLSNFYRVERVLASGQHSLEALVVGGSKGACWGRFVGARRDGSKVDEGFADVYTFESGLIRSRRSYFFRPAV